MDYERLHLPQEQQLEVDRRLLDITIQALTMRTRYSEMAWLITVGSLASRLEDIHKRANDAVFDQIADDSALKAGAIETLDFSHILP